MSATESEKKKTAAGVQEETTDKTSESNGDDKSSIGVATVPATTTTTTTTKTTAYDANWLKGTSAEREVSATTTKKNGGIDYSNPVFKKLSRINGKVNSMSMVELVKSLDELKLDSKGKKEVLIKRLKNHHRDTNLRMANIGGATARALDYVCVIDYEATCSATALDYPHEIIEFPIVLVNMKTLEIEECFNSYCRPIVNPNLTTFCTELTGITQKQVDAADEFPTVLTRVEQWLRDHELGTQHTFAVATDGPWDMEKFLNMQCEHSQLPYPHWARRWIDVRKLFANWFAVRRCSIKKMLHYFGLTFEGQPHSGLDDSKNIARILLHLVKDGCAAKLNSRIKAPRMPIQKKPPTLLLDGAAAADGEESHDDDTDNANENADADDNDNGDEALGVE